MVSQRVIEFLQSFPDLILAMAIAMALGGGLGTVIVAIAITRIPFGGRVIRSVVLSLKEMQYVEAARGIGASHKRLMFRHILPQCVAPYLILATTHLGVAIVIEASLGFLGVGIPPPTPTWGNMLADSLNAGLVPPWWLVLFPGVAITLTVLAFNLLGDGIRDIARPAAARRGVTPGRARWRASPSCAPQRELHAAVVQMADAQWPGCTSRSAGASCLAARHGVGAARVEVAAGRRVDRARHVARQDHALAAARARLGDRHGRQQRLGVGMQRHLEQARACRSSRRCGRDTSPPPGG